MTQATQRNAIALAVGVLFSLGLGISGMTDPAKVIGFLDIMNWDASLLFVMVGAVGVGAIGYPLIRRRGTPICDTEFHVSNRREIDSRLVLGSAIFGVGWGLGGYCPGPAITSLVGLDPRALVFVACMIVGMLIFIRTNSNVK